MSIIYRTVVDGKEVDEIIHTLTEIEILQLADKHSDVHESLKNLLKFTIEAECRKSFEKMRREWVLNNKLYEMGVEIIPTCCNTLTTLITGLESYLNKSQQPVGEY